MGALIRAWAAGTIRKGKELATSGPYAFTRNPLYVGSFFIGLGATIAGGEPLFILVFVLFFAVVYRRAMRTEEEELQAWFGEEFEEYRAHVPLFLPRLTPYRTDDRRGFSFRLYRRNREWEAALGILAGFAVLVGKMVWM